MFIAGAINLGVSAGKARAIAVTILSAKPFANFAKVLAEAGARTNKSAFLANSI